MRTHTSHSGKITVAFAAVQIAFLPLSSAQDVKLDELTPEVEQAINRGLESLAQSQNPDGYWGPPYRVGATSLSLMAFMMQGHFPGRPPYGNTLSRGVDFLVAVSERRPSGFVGNSYQGMYEHGLTTLALSEVVGMVHRQDVHDALKKSVNLIVESQSPDGGWRYQPTKPEADVSATVMQIVALASAKEAGIMVPDRVIEKALEYVKSCYHEPSGGFGYRLPRNPAFPRSAAGVLSLMMCGERDSVMVQNGINYLMNQPASIFNHSRHYYYGHYYAIQVMYQAGDAHYLAWYPKIRDSLLAKQHPDGHWDGEMGVATQMAILTLGVPYRFLPIYQR